VLHVHSSLYRDAALNLVEDKPYVQLYISL